MASRSDDVTINPAPITTRQRSSPETLARVEFGGLRTPEAMYSLPRLKAPNTVSDTIILLQHQHIGRLPSIHSVSHKIWLSS
ncbi:hypothetical protein RRG08_002960 [Elysia crispata]|uniref:Uncharacterized protein n=1 Tax=Elysia crispata TaxID=231223 RepID=A0AAE1ARW5_9GAST|nr:hypothetical protein RRG08_002960 [Elysia crispata]